MKTGHTDSAGFCLVTSALRDGMRLVSVVLGSTSMKARENASAALLNYGFTFYETKLVVKGGATLATAPVWKAASSPVDVEHQGRSVRDVPRGEAADVKTALDVQPRLIAPLARDAIVGQLRVTRRQSDAGDAAAAPLDERRGRRLVAPADRHHSAVVRLSVPLPICHLNGEYLPLSEARVSPLDRAFLFGDARLRGGAGVSAGGRSGCASIWTGSNAASRASAWRRRCRMPSGRDVCRELIARNGGGDQYLYIQVTRGAEFGRNHAWPDGLKPTMFAYATALGAARRAMLETGVAGRDRGRHPLGAARHQIDRAARERSAEEARGRCRRV